MKMRNRRYASIVSIIIGAILLVTIFIPSTSYATEYSVNKSIMISSIKESMMIVQIL